MSKIEATVIFLDTDPPKEIKRTFKNFDAQLKYMEELDAKGVNYAVHTETKGGGDMVVGSINTPKP